MRSFVHLVVSANRYQRKKEIINNLIITVLSAIACREWFFGQIS